MEHSGGVCLMSSCDSRYGHNFIAVLKLLRCVLICQKVVGDPTYVTCT